MDKVLSLLENIGNYLLLIRISDILDIAIIAFLVYNLLRMVKSTRAENILKGVVAFLLVLWLVDILQLNAISYLMRNLVQVGILSIIVLFQPEIRQILEKVGSRNIRLLRAFNDPKQQSELEAAIDQTVTACSEMSQSKTGVLIVFERDIHLDDMVRSGTTLDAAVSSELLKNIFFVKAPMHDGAVIIRRGRILGAGCMLPLSKNVNLSRGRSLSLPPDRESEPRPGYAAPGRYRHERELRRGGGHRFGGNGFHLRGYRRHAQAAPEAGDAGQAAA